MTARNLALVAAFGSFALLIGAYAFQHLGGLAPCKLCLWQRWPHAVAILMGAAVFALGPRLVFLATGAAAALATAGVGLYHVGVEQGWWEGPQGCTGFDISNMSTQDLMAAINAAPLVRCDEIAWAMAGVSMAGWNVIVSVAMALIWGTAMLGHKSVRQG